MQASPRELNPVQGTLAAALSGTATALALLAPRWGGPPTAGELLRGTAAEARTAAELQALAIALCLFVLATLLPWLRRAGWFGCCAGSVLAVGGAGILVMTGLPGIPFGIASAVVAVFVAPRFRERGLASLLLVPVIAPLPALLGVRLQLELAEASRLIGSVQARAPLFGSVVVELPEGAGEPEAHAIALALQLPHRADPVATIAVDEGSVHARWVRQLGLPALRIRGADAELLEADRRAALGHPGKVRVVGSWLSQADGTHRLQVHAPELAGGRLVLFHWGGAREAMLDDKGHATLEALDVLPRNAAKAPLPAGARMQGLAVSPVSADVYGWFDVPMP
jgi:GNAT superfamily N-acetyltransferase